MSAVRAALICVYGALHEGLIAVGHVRFRCVDELVELSRSRCVAVVVAQLGEMEATAYHRAQLLATSE